MASDELKTAAELAIRRLHHQLWRLVDAQIWADEIIAGMERPHDWLVEVSKAKTAADAQEALARAEGTADPDRIWTALMGDCSRLLEAAPERDSEIARVLFHLASAGDVPDRDAAVAMYAFWDAIDLAKAGTFGVLEEERRKLRAFLDRWR